MIVYKRILLSLALLTSGGALFAQQQPLPKQGIYVDKQGVMRWEKDKQEATFFGVNYTAPFAYGYRSIQRTGISIEQAIKDDVYHFSRLGFDAFRVHVWDTEISDSLGNLHNNEHMRLFDFLIAELKKRNIKTLITPIAFWGNGYPEKDEDRGGFSSKYGKQRALLEEPALQAQERFLKQFFQHKNPYTGLTYQNDPDIIAAEVNNEPQHSGAQEKTTLYINRMVKAIRSTGWTKPIFYNISESPKYAGAIVKADVQGHSFQWYPTGLVAGHSLKGNYLTNVARYTIPFDSIPAFKNRAKMVYEFDAGDVVESYMYPAMAKSFRVAGFQWATQFAYDPMATAYGNTEYQTHFLNMAYTPSKAISLLIASKAFHDLPRAKAQASDTSFGAFKVSYANLGSEMNSPEAFYYSNSTTAQPVKIAALKHLAGVGRSAVVNYAGTGAYFLDKLEEGVWRLEVMPDAVPLRDPFERTSADRTVTGIRWASHAMDLCLPELGADFSLRALNSGNDYHTVAINHQIQVKPGTYLITKKGKVSKLKADSKMGAIRLGEYVAPKASPEQVLAALQESDTELVRNSVAAAKVLELFNPATDQQRLSIYNPDWKNNAMQYTKSGQDSLPVLKLSMSGNSEYPLLGFQTFVGDRMADGQGKLTSLKTLVIKVKTSASSAQPFKVGLIDATGAFFSAQGTAGTSFSEVEIPLNSLKADKPLLLPRPYPGFLSLYGQLTDKADFQLKNIEKLELTFGAGLEIASIYLK